MRFAILMAAIFLANTLAFASGNMDANVSSTATTTGTSSGDVSTCDYTLIKAGGGVSFVGLVSFVVGTTWAIITNARGTTDAPPNFSWPIALLLFSEVAYLSGTAMQFKGL